MAYRWNRDKATINFRKHGIDFADAVSVSSDDLAITISDERFDEERFVTIGIDAFGRILVVVYTLRDDEIGSMSPFSGEKQDQYDDEVAIARGVSTHDPGRKNCTRPARSGDCKDLVCRCG